MKIFCCVLLALVVTQALAQPRAVQAIFITDIGSCKTACDASMRTWQRLLRQIPGEREVAVGLHARDARPVVAALYAKELGIPLLEQCPEKVLERIDNMSIPILVLIDQNDQYLFVDNLSKQPIDRLSAIIRRFVSSRIDSDTMSWMRTKHISLLDTVDIGSVQAITESRWLFFDRQREAALYVDVRSDSMYWTVKIPEGLRTRYRTVGNAQIWDAYVKAGVRMTEANSVFHLSESSNTLGFSISQFIVGPPESVYRDGRYVGERDLLPRAGLWVHGEQSATKRQGVDVDTAEETNLVLWSPAAQSLQGTSVFRASNIRGAYADSNEREIAAYANQSGVHLLFRVSALPTSNVGFDPSHVIKLSAMYAARLAVCSPGNEVLGIYDTTTAKFHRMTAVGPLHELLNRERVQSNNTKNYGLGILVDTTNHAFLFVTFCNSEANRSMSDGAVTVTTNAYDVETGQHMYQRTSTYVNEHKFDRVSFHSVRNDELWGLGENKRGVYFVRMKR